MKTRLLTILALNSALCLALPAMAQQGPADVPGAPLIGAEIAPPPPTPEPKPHKAKAKLHPMKSQATEKCHDAKDSQHCGNHHAHQATRAEAREAHKVQPKNKRKQSIKHHPAKKKKKHA